LLTKASFILTLPLFSYKGLVGDIELSVKQHLKTKQTNAGNTSRKM